MLLLPSKALGAEPLTTAAEANSEYMSGKGLVSAVILDQSNGLTVSSTCNALWHPRMGAH